MQLSWAYLINSPHCLELKKMLCGTLLFKGVVHFLDACSKVRSTQQAIEQVPANDSKSALVIRERVDQTGGCERPTSSKIN